jgi:hypothetical protein
MTMTYKTYEFLDHTHHHPFGKNDYSDKVIGVAASSYDYENGECEFIARSQEDLTKWLNFPKYKGIIKI